MIKDWDLVERLGHQVDQFVGLGATDEQIQRLLDNWHVVSALASGRLASLFEEFVPVQPEKGAEAVHWHMWQEKLRHFPVRMDPATTLRERVVRAGVGATLSSIEPFLGRSASDDAPIETLRLKIVRSTKPASDAALERMLSAKLLKPALLAHLMEFAAEHPDSVTPNLFATGSRQYVQQPDGSDKVEIPCIRKAIIQDGDRREHMTLMTNEFMEGPAGGIVYPAMSTFLVVRYPIPRGPDGKLLLKK